MYTAKMAGISEQQMAFKTW